MKHSVGHARRLAASALFVFAIAHATAAPLRAQTCLGLPSADVVRFTTGVTVDDDTRNGAVSGRAAMLGRRTFGSVTAGRTRYRRLDATATFANATFGAMIPVETVRRARLCPMVNVGRSWGPDYTDADRERVENRTTFLNGILAVGMTVPVGRAVTLVPYGRLGAQTRFLTQLQVRGADSLRIESSDVGGTVGGGLGVLLRDRVAITPSVLIPILGFEGARPLYSVALTVGFGRR